MTDSHCTEFSTPWQSVSDETSSTTTRGIEALPEEHWHSCDSEEHHDLTLKTCLTVKRKPHVHIRPQLSTKNGLVHFLCTDKILKFFVVIFYGILPCGFQNRSNKVYYSCLSAIFVLLQWNTFFNYIYFVAAYWTSDKYGLRVSTKTVISILATSASTAVTYTLIIHYFYSKKNNFTAVNGGGWNIIPCIPFHLHEAMEDPAATGLKKQDWALTNLFLFLGLCSTVCWTGLNIALNRFYGFHGIHDFLHKMPWVTQLEYYIAASANTFGCGATIVFCCVFYVITRDLVRHIEYTEKAILDQVKSKKRFYLYHRSLHDYTNKMVASCKHWFAIHTFFFIPLLFLVV